MTPPPSDHSAASITGRAFAVRRKGFDPDEVRAYLGQLAEVVQRLTAERDEARARVADLRAEAETRPAIDEDQLTEVLGEETARVLTSARKAAIEMKGRAEESVATMLREAAEEAGSTRRDAEADAARRREEADRIRAEADEERARVETELADEAARVRRELAAEAAAAGEALTADREAAAAAAREVEERAAAAAEEVRAEAEGLLATRSAEADEAAAAIRAAAEADAEEARRVATDDAEESRRTGEREREALQEEGKAMVAEAQRVRERMLADLSRRRKAARVQLEQLQAARDRLLESYDGVQRSLDEATAGLRRALPDARMAADSAKARAEAEPAATVDELEAQIAAARDAGLPLVAADPTGAPASTGGQPTAVTDTTGTDLTTEQDPSAAADGPDDEQTDDEVEAGTGPIRAEVAPSEVVDGEPRTEEVPIVVVDGDEDLDVPVDETAEVDALFARLKAARDPETDTVDPASTDSASTDTGSTDTVSTDTGGAPIAVDDPVDLTDDGDAAASGVATDTPDGDARSVVGSSADETLVTEASSDPTDEAEDGDEILLLLERRDGALEPIEHRIARRLKRALADEQGRVLDGVRRRQGALLDDLLPLEDQVAAYVVAVEGDLVGAAEEGASFEGAALRSDVSVDDLTDELARSLTALVRPRVDRCFDGGEDTDDLSDRLRATYREWKTDTLVDATRHVVLAAFGLGQQSVRPAGTPVRWVPDPSQPPCPDCEDDALAGVVASGDAFPTGHLHPPAHPGCRCLVVGERVAALA